MHKKIKIIDKIAMEVLNKKGIKKKKKNFERSKRVTHGNSFGQSISRREESQPCKVLLWTLAGCSGSTRRAGRLEQRKWMGSSRG